MKPAIFPLCVFLFTICSGHAASSTKEIEYRTATSTDQKELVEFKFTNEELEELSQWKNKSSDDLWDDAFNCDRAALYMIGMCFLTGSADLTIDVQKADLCFSKSASFGFAPALKQLIHKNIEEENIFLVLVYSNLMSSLGHSEYVVPYHELRTKAMATFGNGISNEIEKVASSKKELIFRTIEKLKKSENRKKFFAEMSYDGSLVNSQDRTLNQDYWIQFTKFQSEAKSEGHRFEHILRNDFQEFNQLYDLSKDYLSKALNKIENNESINEFQLDALKDTKRAMGKADTFISSMESFQNTSNENLRVISKEFILLGRDAKGVLEQHYSFFLDPHAFLESKISMDRFIVCTAGVDEHRENIEELFEKFMNTK